MTVKSQIVLRSPSITRKDGSVTITAIFDDTREMSISISADPDLLDRLVPSIIPFIPVAILTAGSEGRSIYIDANIDDEYWLNLVGSYWPLMARIFEYNDIDISRRGRSYVNQPTSNEVALLFSAGVDSFYSLNKMSSLGVTPKWFVNINAGAHDLDRACWAERIKGVKKVAEKIGARVVVIDTNFHELFPVPHIQSHLMRNISAVYSLYPAVSRYVYSSAHQFEDISFISAKNHGIDYLDHTVCATFTPQSIAISILGWDADRITKTRIIADEPTAPEALDVCVNQQYQGLKSDEMPVNCGYCFKCLRTMITLDHYDLLGRFKSQFPLANFYERKDEHLKALSTRTHPVDIAVAELVGVRRIE